MSPARPPRSGALGARLLALTIIPLAALSVLGVLRVRQDRELAGQRAEVVSAVEFQRAVADVLPRAQLEQFALEGLTRIDELGVPRNVVVAFTGTDLETVYEPNVQELDRALDRLQTVHRDFVLDDGRFLGEEIAAIRSVIELQRSAVESFSGVAEQIREPFDDLDELLDAALRTRVGQLSDAAATSPRQVQIEALGDVLATADQYGRTIVSGLVYRTEELNDETIRALAIHLRATDELAMELNGSAAAEFESVRDGVVEFEFAALGEDGAAERALDPTTVRESAGVALAHLEYVAALERFSDDFHTETADALRAEADDAREAATRTTLAVLAIAAVTLLVAIAVVWSLVVPIRRLTARARAMSLGNLDLPPLREIGPSDLRTLTRTMNQTLETMNRVETELVRLADGHHQTSGFELPGDFGVSISRSFERLTDVTAALHRSEQLSAAIVAEAGDAIWTTDADGSIRSANAAAELLLGVDAATQVGRPISEFLDRSEGESRLVSGPNARRTVLVTRSEVDADDVTIGVVIAHDISERAEFEERLAFQAHHDALTGLPNRFAVLEHLEAELAGNDRIAVLFLDLDGFKAVNDAEGHAAGDQVLADVADALRASVRGDEFVGRLGGDEFVIVTNRFAQIADVTALGYRLIREVEQPRVFGDRMFVLSASVGLALVEPGSPALDAIRRADNALYQAKRMGRGRVGTFDASMQEEIERETELEMALRHAVKNDELVLHLQPLIDLHTGEVSGAESLVRWERPGHGLVPPGDFIPIAERTTLIYEIERWVLHRACELVADWRERDPSCRHRLAVNISGRHLVDGDLVADIDAALALTGADPRMLELELTETQILEDLDRATDVLDRLREQGIRIAVDDFGTGYSSMTYLRELPVDAIKIDRSFVARATEHGYDSTVIEALLTVGRALGLSVVAEGIETDAQLAYVRARGCDRAQGFLLARPMPISDAENILFEPADA